MVIIGSNIKKRRYELRMSQQELADKMGYKSRSTIAKIESGENDVSHKKLQKFAAVLDTTVEELVLGYTSPEHSVLQQKSAAKVFKKNRNVAIILAGGKSSRNMQNIPNQFIDVHGKPIIVYCMEAYESHPAIDDIYVVCLKGWESIVTAYAERYKITKLKGLIAGGASGILSLKNAIDTIKNNCKDDDVIIIQEATRPLVTTETVSKLLLNCDEISGAVICHEMNDYVQFDVSGSKPKYIERESVVAMQSPEAHRMKILKNVFKKAERLQHPLTESCCTMLLYNLGFKVNFVQSSVNNIKIMHEEDIATFEALVK